jgi:hypothetical protein
MDREYDLFERLPDNSVLWRTSVRGIEGARLKMAELAKATGREYFALHAASGAIAARVGPDGERRVRRVFQVAYDQALMTTRAMLLKQYGCEVTSVLGNTIAKDLLSSGGDYDLFIVGHAAAEEDRREMIIWLKKNYANAKILALNPPHSPLLADADFNVTLNGPEKWLAVISAL